MTPFANITTFTATSWTTVPIAQLTGDPFCINAADPQQGVGNHCVCKNGATLDIIPYTTGGNVSDYQPCAYTTVEAANSSTSVFATGEGGTVTVTIPTTTVWLTVTFTNNSLGGSGHTGGVP
ncbi:hypothetical protein B0T25DRAFT_571298 [Lasiosphaeria hispida]|uniref:Uncharacterized protein n=1 Tax=Lasiosphaeria hispida TaxID=260671 RepID=A0AAJ0MAH6_9PEZI|nr:hypothetical protein B0T25DRAFT_571298 [Lasiosphaeria hispida]